jgi:hypothetical protein
LYTNNSKMPNFELRHACRKWAIYYSARPISTCIYCSMLPMCAVYTHTHHIYRKENLLLFHAGLTHVW